MNSNGITMNYTFQSHYYVFYLICQQTLKDEHCMIIFCATAIAIESS